MLVAAQADSSMAAAIQIVLSISGSQVLSNVGTELSFRLPMNASGDFPAMLQQVWIICINYSVL
jgi:hypothetical protein